jgi:signal transduction histidine kinase
MRLPVEIAHDMRSPLTAILFLLDMLRSGRSGPVTATQSRQLGIAYGAAFGLSQMASDLIDHVRGNERLIESHPVEFSVTEMLHSVRDILAPVFEERGLAMHLVPPADFARVGFPMALHRVLLNLATNAVKFTPAGSVTVSASARGEKLLRFEVADTGKGIPGSVQTQLFRPFRSAAQEGRTVFSSSGLGLSICNDLVTALGGELCVTSEEGMGTTFFFELELPVVGHEHE